MITLYDYFRSSAAYRLRIALNLLGLEYQSIPVDLLKGDHKSSENLARNPQGMVPTLTVEGQNLTQSLAILEFLEETHGPRFLPGAPHSRIAIRAFAHAIAVDIHPVLNLPVAKAAGEITDGKTSMKDWMHLFMPSRLAAAQKMLGQTDGPYCFGSNVTLADICLMPQLYNARRWEIDLAPLARLIEIETALSDIPEIAAAHPDVVGAPQ